MDRIASTLTLGFVLALTGCPGDDGTGSDTNAGSTSTADTTAGPTTNPGTTTDSVDTTAGTTTDPGTTTDTPGTTTDEPETTSDGTDSTGEESGTTGNMGMVCDPDPADDMCAECVKMNCCPQLEACMADGDETMGCFCFQECVNAGGAPIGECDGQCKVNPFDFMSPTGQLGQCTLGMCMAECPL